MAPWAPQVPFMLLLHGHHRPDELSASLSALSSPSEFQILELVACVVVPAVLLSLGCTVFALRRMPWPSPIWRLLHFFSASNPFRQFLTFEEIEALQSSEDDGLGPKPIDNPCGRAPWKRQALTAGSALAMVVSVGNLAFIVAAGQARTLQGAEAVVGLALWGTVTLRLSLFSLDTPSYWVLALWTATLVGDAVKIYVLAHRRAGAVWLVASAVRSIYVLALGFIAGTLPIKSVLAGPEVAIPPSDPTSDASCPEDAVTLWQWCTFSFFSPLLRVASTRTLEESDVWQLSPFFKHRNVFRKASAHRASHPRQSLIRSLIQLNAFDLLVDLLLKLWTSIFGFVATYSVKRILDALGTRDPAERPVAYAFALLHFAVNMSFAQADLFQKWHSRRTYERTRGQLFCMLHDKALRRKDFSGVAAAESGPEQTETEDGKKQSDQKGEDTGPANIGRISNLMSTDTYTIAQRFWEFSDVVTVPLRLVIALVFLHTILGWSAFLGLAVVVVAYALNWPLIKINLYIARRFYKARDARMTIANETIQSIRFLKYMGWENKWANKVRDARNQELRWRFRDMSLSVVLSFVWIWVPSAVLLVSFWAFTVLQGRPLTVSNAFVSISLFSNLQGTLRMLPAQITEWLRAMISVRRVERFLAEADVPDWVSTLTRPPSETDVGEVSFEEAIFAWPSVEATGKAKLSAAPDEQNGHSQGRRFVLGPIDATLPRGKLTLVCGATGCGKTSFLTSILGELDCISGRVRVNKGSVAYASQHAWLEPASIRANIVYKTPFDAARYEAVLDACALRQDLAVLDHGDLTEIAERGISLSGGQRARVALARAIYSPAELVLLDDPLAAVDMHTARTLVAQGLCGPLLQNRTVVLVTHHLSLCKAAASMVIHIKDGQVDYCGDATGFLPFEDEEKEALEHESAAAEESKEEKEVPVRNDADAGPESGPQSRRESDADRRREERDKATTLKMIEEEKRAEGRVSIWTYVTYIRAGGALGWILVAVLLAVEQLANVATQLTLKAWGEAYSAPPVETMSFPDPTKNFPRPEVDVRPWLRLYFILQMVGAGLILLDLITGFSLSFRASRGLFAGMLARVVKAPTRWFDRTPVGRILNRFVADMDTVDFALTNSLDAAMNGSLIFVISCGTIVVIVPQFLPFAVLIAWLYIRLAPAYVRCARDLRRLESISRSPMFQDFSNLLHGVQSIRAFAAERRYQDRFFKSCDTFQTMDHHYWLASMWLMWRYDCLGSVVVLLATSFALGTGVQEGLAAICIVQSASFAQASRELVTVFAQLELDFNAVERVGEYLKLDQEAPSINPDRRAPAYWPSDTNGLVVNKLAIRYADSLPMVLKGISFEIRPREKVGVVGRTGSGKSTLALALLRMIEPASGSIVLDGIDICSIGLEDLRTRVTIVSQDVTLFAGSTRSNLDPLDEHSDEECWDVLRRCHLAAPLVAGPAPSAAEASAASETALITSLDVKIAEGGQSYSAGQRQLLALARAMLRGSKVVIMDEATSSIDLDTDEKIQRTIRDSMRDTLVLTIAHRLLTVIDYDRILVLHHGDVVEYDTPSVLLRKSASEGHFRRFCEQSSDWPTLRRAVGV